jgi:hypothetical protein
LVGETEVLGENLPRRHFVHHKFHLPDPGAKPRRRGGTPATNRFSYGAALGNIHFYLFYVHLVKTTNNDQSMKMQIVILIVQEKKFP